MKTKLAKQIRRYIEHEKDGGFDKTAQRELWYHIETLAQITNTNLNTIQQKIHDELRDELK